MHCKYQKEDALWVTQILLSVFYGIFVIWYNHVGLLLVLLILDWKYILSPITLASFVTYTMGQVITIFHLDYCNSFLTGLTLFIFHLDLFILHRKATVILSKLDSDHITHLCKIVGVDGYVHGIDCVMVSGCILLQTHQVVYIKYRQFFICQIWGKGIFLRYCKN